MNHTKTMKILKNQTGMTLEELLKTNCVFLCSSGFNDEIHNHISVQSQLELLCNKGYSCFFIEWEDTSGLEALEALHYIKKNYKYPIWIIAVQESRHRDETIPSCDGVIYADTQQALITKIVSRCDAVIIKNTILYPALTAL